MKHRLTRTAAALCLLGIGVWGVTAGCGGGGSDDTTLPTVPAVDPLAPAVTRGRYRDLEYVLTLPRTQFSVTDEIAWTLAVTNVGSEPVTLQASSSVVEMYSIHKGDKEIQASSPPVSGAIGRQDFAPGQTRTYARQRWETSSQRPDFVSSTVRPKEPGRFTLTAWLAADRYNNYNDDISGANGFYSRGALSPPSIEFTIK